MANCKCSSLADFHCLGQITTAPAYLGINIYSSTGQSLYNSPQYVANYNNSHSAFIVNMWNGWMNGINLGNPTPNNPIGSNCEFWINRVSHWTNQINSNSYNTYQLGRKQAKITFAQKMWVLCKCSGPPPQALIKPNEDDNPEANVGFRRGTAPEGFHYMPDGKLMSDAEHAKLYKKTITGITMDFEDIPTAGAVREFSITGDSGAEFYLEIKNEDSKYYNFVSKTFQTKRATLEREISNNTYTDFVVFPAVTDNDQYDIYLYVKPGTEHVEYTEVHFPVGKDATTGSSVDLNSSTGSNSILLQKVIYQVLDVNLEIKVTNDSAFYSGTSGVSLSGSGSVSVTNLARFQSGGQHSFEITGTVTSGALVMDQQPSIEDVFAFDQPVVGAAPIDISGENIYPTATAAFTGDDINGAVTSGSVVRMDNTDLSAVIKVGDKITTTVMTDTVNGDFRSGSTAITMDSAVATKMAVGDQVTGTAELDATLFTVASIDSTYVFSLNSSAVIEDGTTLSFSSKINRSLTTVTVVETSGTATDFTMSQAIQFRDNAPLTFFNRMNYQWPIVSSTAFVGLTENMRIFSGTGEAGSYLYRYEDKITIDENTEQEREIIHKTIPAVDTRHTIPLLVRGKINEQSGNVVFNKQQPLSLAGDELHVGAYDLTQIKSLTGWDVSIDNIKASLNTVTTTTTSAVSASTTIPVASVLGIADETTQVSVGSNVRNKTTVEFLSVSGLRPGQTIRTISSGTLVGNPSIVSVDKLNKKIIISQEQLISDGVTVTFENSTISGPGITPGVADPFITNISGSNLTVSAAQTLEDGQTFTFPGAGNVVTITGIVTVNKVGPRSLTLNFDINNFITPH